MLNIVRYGPVGYVRPWILVSALGLWLVAPFASAESLPASVRSCVTESNPDRRLACFDKAVASFPETPSAAAAVGGGAAGTLAAGSASQTRAAQDSPTQPAVKQPQSSTPKETQHMTARVASIEYPRGQMVFHLDNGQVWEQAQGSASDVNLRAGDSVTIDKIMGAYWLGGRSSEPVKVRQRQ